MGRFKKISVLAIVFVLIVSLLSACQDANKGNDVTEGPSVTEIKDKYNDPSLSVDEKVSYLIEIMTLEEKIGQMLQPDRTGASPSDVKKYFIGSVFSGGGNAPSPNTMENWLKMCEDYQKAAMSTRLGIPIIYGVDAVHGHNTLPDAVIFPHNIGLGATGNPELVAEIGRITAAEMIATGVNWNFAPCVAAVRDQRWGRSYESFSENPELVSKLSVPYIKAMQDEYKIITTAKHYLADGGTKWGTGEGDHLIDQGDAQISEEELKKIHLPMYEEAVKAGVKTVMVSFSSWNGVKMHENQYLIQDVLKGELGFEGFVVSDYEAVHQLSGKNLYNQLVASVNAGVDMFMEPLHWRDCISNIKKAVKNGDITEERINDAVSRILKVKFEVDLFNNPVGNRELAADTLGSDENREIAKQAVRESLVLLKNERNVLPLKKKAKIFVSGPAADNVGIQCGGWTKTWQGGLDSSSRWVKGSTILDGFKKIAEENGGTIYTDPDDINKADVAVIVIGEKPYAEFEGDEEKLDLYSGMALEGNKEALELAKKARIPVVVILVSGRARIVTEEIKNWDAFVAAWLPGSEGDAVAEVLYGDYEFKGKLPVTWPSSEENLKPGDKSCLFPFGYGFTMTE
ncbi:MAG TPA: glycoside hydrolase family 3 protein [Acetivibrio sp.]|nr:glycoside hydrolase family 3 protein [Clostridium sp.]HOQ36686.1 glycoside hydrolase family 3 protein [Acetivibrio sp.]HPT90828.1 glycoside hydrolase family 3 protein [Acetivibrio sp.]HQA57944.1 glycoside hydrolase family 3 protein [Acetivibrio sp.]